MGFWSSVFRRARRARASGALAEEAAVRVGPVPSVPASRGAPSTTSPPVLTPARAPGVARLLRFAEGDREAATEDDALAILRSARATSEEGRVLDGLVQRGRLHPLPERLTLAVAVALLDRGDRVSARALLATTDATGSLFMRAELLADEGDFAGAVAMIERTLLRDFDLAGARERRQAWRARLGLHEHETRAVDLTTVTLATPRAGAPFDLLREVARGGAAVVFAARDRELGRNLALKVYHQPGRDLAQLLHEGRVAASLEGPGIVRVFDVEPTEGWLALEWASLGALRDLMTAPAPVVARLAPLTAWLPSLARALARVHAAGWVHHDVKPANVLMHDARAEGRDGVEPWLGDFGTARRVGEPSPPGSLGYVSPERLAGRVSDPRDDVYGLGRVIEEVLAAMSGRVDGPGGPRLSAEEEARWKRVAAVCIGPTVTRPATAASVLELIERT